MTHLTAFSCTYVEFHAGNVAGEICGKTPEVPLAPGYCSGIQKHLCRLEAVLKVRLVGPVRHSLPFNARLGARAAAGVLCWNQ